MMLLSVQRQAKTVLVSVLIAGLVALITGTRAEANTEVSCSDPSLSGVTVNATLAVDEVNRIYPHFTATTEYEIPSTWPDVTALLGSPKDQNYDAALRCFVASWPQDQISQLGEYRQHPPVVRIMEAKPAANGSKVESARILLHDEVTGDLTTRTAPPFLGPWKVETDSDQLQIRLISTEPESSRPLAFDSMKWAANIHLSGLHFKRLEPTPGSTDSEREASWAPIDGTKSGVLKIGVELDKWTQVAIAANSGTMAFVSHTTLSLIDAIFYFALLIFLLAHRKTIEAVATEYKRWRQVRAGIRATCWISVLGLALGAFRTTIYWWYGKDAGFDGLGMPAAYYRWPGLIIIWAVGLTVLIFSLYVKRTVLTLFALSLLACGAAVLIFRTWFDLDENFTPTASSPTVLAAAMVRPGSGQLALMILLTCGALFVAATILHFIFRSMQLCARADTQNNLGLPRPIVRDPPYGKILTASFLVSLAVILHWVWQRTETWNRNNLFPAFDNSRSSQQALDMTSGMITYYLGLFEELVVNPVPWAAAAAIIYTLCWLGRGTQRARPSTGEYRALGLLFAVFVFPTGEWYIGFTIPIGFAVAFIIAGFIFPWSRRFNPLETIYVQPGDAKKSHIKRALFTMLPGPMDLRRRLIGRQVQMDALRARARNLDSDLATGKVDFSGYMVQREEIESSLNDCQFPPPSQKLWAITQRRVAAKDSIDLWQLPSGIRPADVALAIGPRAGWWENGILAAKIGAVLSTPAVAYFCYIDITRGLDAFDNYLAPLHWLWFIIWEFGFWVVAAFILGCLWTTLPGRQGSAKGVILWMGFVIPDAISFALGRRLLHQDPIAGAVLHIPLLLIELFMIGLIMDWFTLLEADTFRINKWRPFVTLYGVQRLVPTLTAVVPLVASLVGVYLQVRSGLGGHGLPSPPANPSPKPG